MIRQLSVLLVGVSIASNTLAADEDFWCHIDRSNGGTYGLSMNTPYNYGPNVYASIQNNYGIAVSIADARDAWDATYAANRVGAWSNSVSASDCPYGLGFQIGHFNFQTVSCATVTANNAEPNNSVALVDWAYGTFSISVNTYFTFVTTGSPMTGQYDLTSILTHEFGHVLGFHHQQNGVCDLVNAANPCSIDPGRDTMGKGGVSGETCTVTLEQGDIDTANHFFGP